MAGSRGALEGALSALLDAMGEGLGAFFQFCYAAIEGYDSLPLNFKYTFKKQIIDILSKANPGQAWDELFRNDREFAQVLAENGWWVLERDINGPVQREILRLGRGGDREGIDRYIIGLFSENNCARLDVKTEAWFQLPYLGQRREIVSDCTWAHKQRKYTLTIPCLLPLIDGLLRCFDETRPERAERRKSVIRSGRFVKAYKEGQQDLWGASFAQAIEEVFQGFDFSLGSPATPLNRHGILHGILADYGTESNSLKLFLVIDTIQSFVQAVEASLSGASGLVVSERLGPLAPKTSRDITVSRAAPTPKRPRRAKQRQHLRRRGPSGTGR